MKSKSALTFRVPLVISVFLIVFSTHLASQSRSHTIDSLRSVWYAPPGAVPDSSRLQSALWIQSLYAKTELDSFRCISNEIINYGKARGSREWEAQGWRSMGKYYHATGKPDSAISTYRYALGKCDSPSVLNFRIYGAIGLSYGTLNQLDSAIYYLKHAIVLAKEFPEEPTATIYGNLSACYESQGNFVEALKMNAEVRKDGYSATSFISALNSGIIFKKLGLTKDAIEQFKEAAQYASRSQNPADLIKSYSLMLQVSANLNEAQSYLDKGLALADSLKLYRPALFLLEEAGQLFLDSMQLDKAAFYLDRCLSLAIQSKDESSRLITLLHLANLNCLQGNYRKSLQICQEVLPYFEKNNSVEHLNILYDVLSKNYEALGQPSRALYFLKKKNIAAASLNDNATLKAGISAYIKVQNQQEQDKIRLEKENAEARAAASIARERLSYWVFGFISLSLLGLVCSLFIFYRQRMRSAKRLEVYNTALQNEQEKLRRSNEKLYRFSGIISHDVLSNLDLILSTGNVLVGPQPKKESLVQYYDMTQRASRQLKNYCIHLLEEARQTQEHLASTQHDPMPVLQAVLGRFKPALDARNFQVEIADLSPTRLPAALVEQLFQNLVSNALRYGATALQPLLRISEEQDAQGRTCWVVEDNGPGVAVEQGEAIFQSVKDPQTQEKSQGQGLGLSLTRAALRDAGADIRVEERAGGGARFVICINFTDGHFSN